MKKNIKTISIIIAIAIALALIFFLIKNQLFESTNPLTPAESISHVHEFALDVRDPSKLYIATHHGLLVLINEKDLYHIGKNRNDLMGFLVHTKEPNIFFSSGHPTRGGNLGFQKSEDGGFTWKKISDGVGGPVDFHLMTVSPVNPDFIYGWYEGELQRSQDGGRTWELVSPDIPEPNALVSDPQVAKRIYSLSIFGILVSDDRGSSWSKTFLDLGESIPSTLSLNPSNSSRLLVFTRKLGLVSSTDGGVSWKPLSERFNGELVIYFARSPQKPELVYAMTRSYAIYRSDNEGETWIKIR